MYFGNRIWFDTEFIEDGKTIELLSIGLVNSHGQEYYAEVAETDRSRASEWVKENVIPLLTGPIKPREQIKNEIIEFVGDDPEFWAYYASYDWVALCQLFGTMMDLPKNWPMFVVDFRQVMHLNNVEVVSGNADHHNALYDAKWLRDVWMAWYNQASLPDMTFFMKAGN